MEKLNTSPVSFYKKSDTRYFLFSLVAVTILVYGFLFSTAHASTDVTADIMSDTTWDKQGSPYIIKNSIYVDKPATLTIEPGVVVKFDVYDSYYFTGYSLDIAGKLMANGTKEDPIYFTSIYDDEVGGNTDEDYENCYFEDYDAEGYGIGEETCEMLDWYEPMVRDWDGIYFSSSSGSILNNVFVGYAYSAFTVEESNVNFQNLNIKNSYSGLDAYMSNVKVSGGNFDNVEDVFTFFDESSLEANNISITNAKNGFTGYVSNNYKQDYPEISSYDNSKITITDSNISCSNEGVSLFNNYSLIIKKTDISCLRNGIVLFNEVKADIDSVKVSGSEDEGIIAFNNTAPDSLKVTNSEITDNGYGFLIFNTSFFTANRNSIHGNFIKGADTFSGIDLDFSSNYWGDPTGPTHASNPSGLGDVVSDNITFLPFLKSDPLKNNGLSNVMFIPGFQASRMYKMVGDSEIGTEFENKLWEPGIVGNVSGMYMDDNGESIDKGIYTRDIMDEAKVFGLNTINFYKSFMSKMDSMVSDGEIASWKPIAYDWRQSPLDIVRRGIEKEDGGISYIEELRANQVPYIIGELQKLSDTSNSGKVTIVTHSNGGLVAKALISKLRDMKISGEGDLIDKIDNLITVAPPLVGTPKAMMGILHGYDQGMMLNILLNRKDARDFGQNVPGAYGLLPSIKYLSSIENKLISFDESLSTLNNWIDKYGDSIDTYDELQSFLLDKETQRLEPDHDDLVNPTILNEIILSKVNMLHDGIDNLTIPESIKVHQIVGWGLPTPYDLRYKAKNECLLFSKFLCSKKEKVLSSDIGFTGKGDGTVVGASALYGEGKEYYLDLNGYNNKPGTLNRDHVNIFEISYVFDLINNILKSDNTLPEYISEAEPTVPDFTVIKMRSPVSIDIYNRDGLHTGLINNETGEVEESIPNSLYMEFGEEKYIVVPKDGDYELKIAGLSDGIFSLEQDEVIGGVTTNSIVFSEIPTTSMLKGKLDIVDGSLATSLDLDNDGDGIFEKTILPTDLNKIEQEKDEVKIEKTYTSSGSYPMLALNKVFSEIKNDNLLEDYIVNNNEQIIENIKEVKPVLEKLAKENNINKDISSEEGKVLGASVNSSRKEFFIDSKVSLLIFSGFIVLLLGLKFIFKVK